LTVEQHRADRHSSGRSVGPFSERHPQNASMIADTAGLDVEYHVVAPAMQVCVPAQGRARREQGG
jgi:hypothetical protein